MDRRIAIVTKVARILAVAAVIGIGGQLAAPVLAHAKSTKCFGNPDPNNPGTFIIKCSTSRP
jgi:hypothetical protein